MKRKKLAMRREILEKKSSEELFELLKDDTSLASKFDKYSLWDKLSHTEWSSLLIKRP